MQLKTNQPQRIPTNPDLRPLMAQQISTSRPIPRFTVPATHVFSNWSACKFLTRRCSVPNVNTSLLAAPGLSRAPNQSSDNKATIPQVVPATSDGTVYYWNPFSGSHNFGDVMPINVLSAAPMSVENPELLPFGLLHHLKQKLLLLRYRS